MIVILDGCLLLSEIKLRSLGIKTYLIKPGEFKSNCDKCKFINEIYDKEGCILVSFLENRANSLHTCLHPSESSKILASFLSGSAEKFGKALNRPSDSTAYWKSRVALCRCSKCPSIQVRGYDVTGMIVHGISNYLDYEKTLLGGTIIP